MSDVRMAMSTDFSKRRTEGGEAAEESDEA